MSYLANHEASFFTAFKTMSKPHIFQSFDEYYQATKSNLIAPNQEFHIFRYSDLSPEVVRKMDLFRLTFYQFCICQSSQSLISIAGNTELSRDKQLIIFTPGQLAQWEKIGNWEGYLIFVKESFVRLNSTNMNARLMHSFLRPDRHPLTNLTNEDFNLLAHLCEKMIYEYKVLNDENLLVIENYIQVLLVYIKRIQDRDQSDQHSVTAIQNTTQMDIHSRFLELVEKKYLEQKSVTAFASQMNITPGYLNDCVKLISGKSAKEIINEVILLEAKSLLKHTSIPIKEIAYQLNYQDYSHFVKFFKSGTGLSPAGYRDSN